MIFGMPMPMPDPVFPKACIMLLQCVAHNGIDASYLHSVHRDLQRIQYLYDGSLNEQVLDAVRNCIADAKPKYLDCDFHPQEPLAR